MSEHPSPRARRGPALLFLAALAFAVRLAFADTPAPPARAGATYYVAVNGSDDNTPAQAANSATPWATITHASTVVQPGDTVHVASGDYPAGYTLISATGAAAAPITFVGASPAPRLTMNTGSTVTIRTAQYIVFDHFDVTNTDHVVNSKDGGNGIYICGASHHVTVENCVVHDCGGGGIGTGNQPDGIGCDYVTIKRNTVYNNAWYSWYICSGISLWELHNADPTDSGYHNFVTGNVCYGNSNKGVTDPAVHTDGEGIIMDVSYSHGSKGGADARSYVGYNVCYGNGGSGVQAFHNNGVTFDHNTCYGNARDPAYTGGGGELYINQATGCALTNNIGVSLGERRDACIKVYPDARDVTITGNDCWNGATPALDPSNLVADPRFADPTATPPDFRLRASSPAVGRGAWSTASMR
jgi:hypothetical protein